jgi:hypothetical protein
VRADYAAAIHDLASTAGGWIVAGELLAADLGAPRQRARASRDPGTRTLPRKGAARGGQSAYRLPATAAAHRGLARASITPTRWTGPRNAIRSNPTSLELFGYGATIDTQGHCPAVADVGEPAPDDYGAVPVADQTFLKLLESSVATGEGGSSYGDSVAQRRQIGGRLEEAQVF